MRPQTSWQTGLFAAVTGDTWVLDCSAGAALLELADRQGARLKTLDPDLLALRRRYPWIE
jgi:hypothetical protein